MNISYNWLKDLIDHELSADELAAQLTRVGLAVEGVHPHGDDFVLDVDLTSNRPDCLSHLGVARELGAVLDGPLKTAEMSTEPPVPAVLAGDLVKMEDADLCHRFTARIIRGVKIGPSPQWIVDRLEAVGERSINNVADITNYVMLELGQPMHSFDLAKLAENRIVVRRARSGETIRTLDEVDRKLETSMLAICDAEKPVAVGGVMGGLDSSITDDTKDVLLEVAYFSRPNIRATSRKLGLATEASYRFERGVDIQNLKRASDRAADLICELAGGTKGEFVDVFPTQPGETEVVSKDIAAATLRLTGLDVRETECVRILDSLGITSEANEQGRTYVSPSWRHDIGIEEDLVEEVARHVGYENIKDELPPAYGAGEYQPHEHREKQLRQVLADQGFNEAVSYSFIDKANDDIFELAPGVLDVKAEEPYVELQDAVIEGAVRMRPTILPGLLDAVRLNINHQRRNLKLFEVGKVFSGSSNELGLPAENELLTVVVTGGEEQEDRGMTVRDLDFFDAKGAVESALSAIGIDGPTYSSSEVKHLRKGQTARVSVDGEEVGSIGRLSDELASKYKFRQAVYVAELNLGLLLDRPAKQPAYQPLSRFPAITRDVSFVVKRDVGFADIISAVTEQGFELCRDASFVDIYEGKGLADDERSVTIRLEYRSDERTLIEDEVEGVHAGLIAGVENKLGIKQRF
nr:phenylalanyl-tRNA synthetase beta chain [uncultured bacterium]